MGFAIELRFPHRQYQATPWDAAVNSGHVEWPPSPWRLMRALLSVWHRMHPELSADLVDQVLDALRPLPEIRLPDSRSGHTRHYMPKTKHRSGVGGETALTLAPYRAVAPDDPIVLWWPDGRLDSEQESTLRTLLSGLGYFGRAESICEARLTDTVDAPGTWVLPDPNGPQRILAVTDECTRADLEETVVQMKKVRLTRPPGSKWARYTAPAESDAPQSRQAAVPVRGPEAIRWTLTSKQPFPAEKGLLATTALRQSRVGELRTRQDAVLLHGHLPRGADAHVLQTTEHRHAHWLWIIGQRNGVAQVTDLVLWVPGGIPAEYLPTMLRGNSSMLKGEVSPAVPRPPGRPYEFQLPTFRYSPGGYVAAPFQLTQVGSRKDVFRDWGWDRKARTWTSVTPYLMTIYPKKNRPFEREVDKDFARQWTRHGLGLELPRLEISQERYSPAAGDSPVALRSFVRHRPRKTTNSPRIPLWLTLRFDDEVEAPPPLGELCHFGFGVFKAVD